MGLMDLFRPNPTPGLSDDPGIGLPKLFNDESRARLGVLGSNLIAAGFGNSPNAQAVLGLGELSDKRKQDKKLQAAAKRYADKIRAKNPDLAEAIDADYTLISTVMGKDIDQQNAMALKKYEYDLDPMNKLYDDVIRGAGGEGAPSATVDEPLAGKSDFGAPPPAVMAPPVNAVQADGSFQDAVYRPGIEPVAADMPVTPARQYTPQQQRMIQFSKQFHPDYTDAEALRWFPNARNSDRGQAAANQIQSDREYNQTAAAKLTADAKTADATIAAARREEAFKREQSETAVGASAEVAKQKLIDDAAIAARPAQEFTERLPPPLRASQPGQDNPDGTPYMGAARRRQEQIATDAGLPPELNTLANTRILESAAAKGPQEYAAALEKITTVKEPSPLELYRYSQKQRADNKLPPQSFDEWAAAKAKAGAATTIIGAQEKKYETVRGESFAKKAENLDLEGMAAMKAVGNLNRMEQLMAKPDFFSGSASSIVLDLKRAGKALGLSQAPASMEEFNALSKQATMDQLGGSLGTGISNADRDFLEGQVANAANTVEGNKGIISANRKIQQRKIEYARQASKYEKENGQIDIGFQIQMQEYGEANPIFDPVKDAIEQSPEGKNIEPADKPIVPPMPQSAKDANITQEEWEAGDPETWGVFK